eukprot:CAMPEP_0182456162 /NCGR_PEP_ID=MMETSP1319-20130603/2079_1 /TAXON_ID=172717 /ORGANISM="Bolidomonas pacifica, Strain RCC208" /LENGTH=291 /DNA_ID=CAMNT_0024654343 /DNA_START=134 /DNA_END=1006 /DNA_ORIENTATION=-
MSTCSGSAIDPAISLPVLAVLLVALIVLSYVYWTKRSQLIALYADPRNRIVTFMKPSDFMGGEGTPHGKSRRRTGQGRDVLEEAARIELGEEGKDTGSADSVRESGGRGSGTRGSSVIFVKDPTSIPSKGDQEHRDYEWEIPFKEIKLTEKLGAGQYGDVYSGEWLDTKVAVKIPRTPNSDVLRRFLREVKLMSILHHPNIVLFLGACITKPDICLVMEYLPGGSLFDYIHSESPTVIKSDLQMLSFAVDCARGMKYLHHRVHLVQRDLKSSNLLIDATLNLKIADFGLSK